LKNAAISLGITESRIDVQKDPRTTAEEASTYLRKFGAHGILILVTSAAHMPRAMKLFEGVGLQPVPAPAGFQIKNDPKEKWQLNLFSARNFQKVKAALHEYIGLVWARWGEKG
jgi:uncharacterized SAM-binding protein YcdF (DUF218 family)